MLKIKLHVRYQIDEWREIVTFHATADVVVVVVVIITVVIAVVVIVVAINLGNNLRKDKITCGRGIHSH